MPVASCHCGAVRVEIPSRPLRLTDCNCSICRRYGALWGYYRRRDLRVEAAPDAVVAYRWGDETIDFVHCRTCGCVVYHEAAETRDPDAPAAINARMLDPADTDGARIRRFDGAATWAYLDEADDAEP